MPSSRKGVVVTSCFPLRLCTLLACFGGCGSYVSSRVVSLSDGGLNTLCLKIGYGELNGADKGLKP